MRSNQFVEQAVEALEREQPELCEEKESRADCIKDFKNRLSITQLKEGNIKTRVIEVSFTGHQKEQTFKFLLALQKLYRVYNVEQQQARIDDRLAIFDYQLSTGEDVLSQFPQSSEQLEDQTSSDFSRKGVLTSDSSQPPAHHQASLYGQEIPEEERYSKAAQTESEKAAVIQLIHLRQEMANNLIQSGFTWELVEYPATGRKVVPRTWPKLGIGLLLNGVWVFFKKFA